MARYIDTTRNSFPTLHQKELNDYMKGWNACLKSVLQQTPTADVAEVKHGNWIISGNEKKCSVCDFVYYSNNDEWNGCPNCLSRMDGKGAT